MSTANTDKTIERFGGEGPAVALVHGFGADRYSWLGVAPELAKHASVYTIELPGHGNAWELPAAEGLSQLCNQVLNPATTVIAAESGTPVHLVGHSLGGALVLLAAADNPALVASVSLIAPLGLGGGANAEFIEKFPDLDNEASTLELLQRTVFNKRLISSQLIAPLTLHLRKTGVRPTLKALANDVLNPCDELVSAIAQISASDLPRQVIWGLNDTIMPLAAGDESRFGGHWHTVDNCGHLPHVEQRIQVNRLLLDMVQRDAGV